MAGPTDLGDDLIKAAEELLKSVQTDESLHGGLLTRETTRKGDELRLVLSRVKKEIGRG